MITFTYTITDASGIHARPAGLLVKQAAGFPCAITLQKGEKTADAKRIFAVMSLAAKQGETITVSCDGEDEGEAAKALEAFLAENL
ncbi:MULTISPECIES: HPr family phosphocarrier protein [Eubacteriales]|uniref:Phosphocarrier protein n=1 Tax=Bittarella massiliensis (ex Durand et al. 2017) TaxID=1720313 RepID=A0AAQ1MC47_9FIRM|nr:MULTISPECIES: HPr family phosphocarrier protein [Eubacteriales]ERI99785.1 putative phosphocarrier protein HPr [Clostridium sp. ATCC 29733]MZL70099.1 HPr family phosphocarrier protein [Bittarella massiliensis (ex Durand et al. 2017)]MZL81197.1 HPr family phosphocarrier protein [Bittarella massiliensis (ex Durand et al. 2017)]SHF82288.1 phosphocarrier protein [Bittarella massiliensis (ex Durand et al. 2017)]